MPDRVRVKSLVPPGHVRTPYYLRGKVGVIERRLGETENPEELAYNRHGAKADLVRVRFTMGEIWGNTTDHPQDTLDAEVFSHWLEPA